MDYCLIYAAIIHKNYFLSASKQILAHICTLQPLRRVQSPGISKCTIFSVIATLRAECAVHFTALHWTLHNSSYISSSSSLSRTLPAAPPAIGSAQCRLISAPRLPPPRHRTPRRRPLSEAIAGDRAEIAGRSRPIARQWAPPGPSWQTPAAAAGAAADCRQE